MNKFSYLALGMAMFIGVVLASFFTRKQYKKELYQIREQERVEYNKKIQESERKIQYYERVILHRDSVDRVDSLTIVRLKEDISKSNIKIQILRQEAKKLKPHEKANYLIDRYKSKP